MEAKRARKVLQPYSPQAMKTKNLLLLFGIGLTLGLSAPQAVDAISFGSGKGLGGTFENTTEVDPIDSTPDYNYGEYSCTDAQHVHYHYNLSETPSDGEIWGIVHQFAIALDTDYSGGTTDFMDNVDTTTLLCSDGGSFDADGDGTYENRYEDCGFDKTTITPGTPIMEITGGRWSGVTVTYDTLDWITGSPRGLIWDYGTSDITDLNIKPWLASDGGSKREGVSFGLEDYTSDHYVTTQSWTKMEYYYFHDDGSYEHIYTEDVDPDGDGNDEETNVDPDGDYVYWYGINSTQRSFFPACVPALSCADLTITPDTLNVSDVFSDTEFSLTATNNEGDDITNEVEITYQAYQYDGSASTGDIMTGPLNGRNRNAGPTSVSDTDIEYVNSLPGDRLTAYVSDYEGASYEDTCSVEVEWPYCADLQITDPSSIAFISTGDVDIPIEVEATANNGEEWPYSLDYTSMDPAATFDGNTSVYTTTDKTIDSYQSSTAADVIIGLDDHNGDGVNDDIGSPYPLCSDSFSYGLMPTCESLEITIPTSDTLTCEEITTEDILITWESFMTSGAPSTGPWLVTSTNSGGTFSLTPGGPTVGTGSYVSITPEVYYTSNSPLGGDAIQVTDISYPACTDSFDSETCTTEAPVCDDLTLGTPYIENADGSTTSIDLTNADDLDTLYGTTTVCWDYSLNVSDTSYAGRIVAEGFTDTTGTAYNGTLALSVNETSGGAVGNPATTTLTGYTTYTGTICWQNFEAGNYLSVFMLGDELACSDDETLPPPSPEAPVCLDLQLSPDQVTMSATDTDTGNVLLTIDVQGSDSTWTGTLVVEETGVGALFYSDGSPSSYGDGHLEIPVSGASSTVLAFYRNGREGDSVRSYVVGNEDVCEDSFPVTKTPPTPGEVCEDVYFEDEVLEVDLTCEDEETTLCTEIDSDGSRTIEVCYETDDGDEGTFTYNGSTYTGCEEITVTGTPGSIVCEDVEFAEVCDGAEIEVRENVSGSDVVCEDIQTELSTDVCEDIEFEEDDLSTDYDCEDTEANLCIEGDSDGERTVEICYEDEDGNDGEWTYDGDNYEGCEEITVEVNPGETECLEIGFNEVCEDAVIEVYEEGEVCEDIPVEEVEMGSFEKFIFTFNFASEKNSYTDEGVFFSHDEDRAFYTLEYDPTGDEEDIIFTDAMWGNDLEGHKGDGTDSGGTVRLATSYDELVKSEYNGAYDEYNLITNMGFGCEYDSDGNPNAKCREENSEDLASYVASSAFQSDYKSFIAYIKYPSDFNRASVVIDACEYDEEGELESEDVCFDPNVDPETDGQVVIENAGTVEEDYGVEAAIRIRYVGVINSGLDCGATDTDECLTEEFENIASVQPFESLDSLTASARLVVLCSYLMTQNAGDVYLEVSLEGGSDIACIFVDEDEVTSSDYRNVDSLIILEDDDDDEDSTYVTVNSYSGDTISFCDDDEDNLIGNLSSYVCEIVAKVTDLWAKSNVENTTNENVSQATRNADTDQIASDSTYSSWSELEAALRNANNSNSNILYFDGSLSDDEQMTLGNLTVPAGAWTIIVKDADLKLTGNIAYETVSNPSDYKNLPSVAFVVEGGDIFIDDSALRLVGVYYTDQKFDGEERSAVDEQLTVDGSFYGNIQTLIERAKYVGPPTIDGGGIVIRYDSRIILNTPPALSDYVNINTEKGVN